MVASSFLRGRGEGFWDLLEPGVVAGAETVPADKSSESSFSVAMSQIPIPTTQINIARRIEPMMVLGFTGSPYHKMARR